MHILQNYKYMLWYLLLFLVVLCLNQRVYAQVTIGSMIPPNKGSLLDLKETDSPTSNANKGLLLPRVNITSQKSLSDISGAADSDRAGHTALTVYNVNNVYPFCKGVYVWSSVDWVKLGLPCGPVIEVDDIDFGTNVAAQSISIKTNTRWSYVGASNLSAVVQSMDKEQNTVYPGGLESSALGEAIIMATPVQTTNDPAGAKYTSTLTFTTEDFSDGREATKTINISRTVASYFSNLVWGGASIGRVGGKYKVGVNTNDEWSISSGGDITNSPPPSAPGYKELEVTLPANNQWRNNRALTVSANYTNSVTGESKKYNNTVAQEGYKLGYNAGSPASLPGAGGTVNVPVWGDGTIQARLYSGGGLVGGSERNITLTPSAKNVTYGVGVNESWNPRNIQVRLQETGVGGGNSHTVYNVSQAAGYFYIPDLAHIKVYTNPITKTLDPVKISGYVYFEIIANVPQGNFVNVQLEMPGLISVAYTSIPSTYFGNGSNKAPTPYPLQIHWTGSHGAVGNVGIKVSNVINTLPGYILAKFYYDPKP